MPHLHGNKQFKSTKYFVSISQELVSKFSFDFLKHTFPIPILWGFCFCLNLSKNILWLIFLDLSEQTYILSLKFTYGIITTGIFIQESIG